MKRLNRLRQVSGYVVVSLLLTMLGNAVWEAFGRTSTQWLTRTLLTSVTLGSQTMRDFVYRDAAQGYHEASSLYLLLLLLMLLFNLFGASVGYVIATRQSPQDEAINHVEDDAERARLFIAKREAADKDIAKSKTLLKKLVLAYLFLQTLFVSIHYLGYAEANDAYRHYAQAFTICSPYFDERERLLLASEFASIQSRADYLAVLDRLKQVADANGRKLPSFSPW